MRIDRDKFLAAAMALGLTAQGGCGAGPRGSFNYRHEENWGGAGLGRVPPGHGTATPYRGPSDEYYPTATGYAPYDEQWPTPADEYYPPVYE